jgi:hypothetical protein
MPTPEDTDHLAPLLLLSVAERQQAIEALLDSLGAEPAGPALLKRVRSSMDRRLRRQAGGGKSGWGGQGLSRR